MSNKILRVGVIGLGRAAGLMLPALRAHPGLRVVAGADPNPDARARFAQDLGGRAYPDGEALCAEDNVDAVYIATPHERHAMDVIMAMRCGKHAIVEKPMALTVEDCDAMIAAAEKAGRVLMVGPTHATDPGVLCMRRIVESGELGRPRMFVNIMYSDFLYRPRRPEELDPNKGGGIMFNQVPHQIDMVRTIHQGGLRCVHAMSEIWDPARPVEGAMSAFLEFEDGATASLVYSGYGRFDTDELHGWVGESGMEKSADTYGAARKLLASANAAGDEKSLKARIGFAGQGMGVPRSGKAHHPHFGALIVSCERGDMRVTPDGVEVYSDTERREIVLPLPRAYPNKDALTDSFYDAVVCGNKPLHDGAWGREGVRVMLALRQSARERRTVRLSSTTE
jgi:phthalate 4,5-cis-dihydrodiol dehydrogenase